jgi:hypothetical protein
LRFAGGLCPTVLGSKKEHIINLWSIPFLPSFAKHLQNYTGDRFNFCFD